MTGKWAPARWIVNDNINTETMKSFEFTNGLQKEGLVCKIRDVVFYIFAKIHRVYK